MVFDEPVQVAFPSLLNDAFSKQPKNLTILPNWKDLGPAPVKAHFDERKSFSSEVAALAVCLERYLFPLCRCLLSFSDSIWRIVLFDYIFTRWRWSIRFPGVHGRRSRETLHRRCIEAVDHKRSCSLNEEEKAAVQIVQLVFLDDFREFNSYR